MQFCCLPSGGSAPNPRLELSGISALVQIRHDARFDPVRVPPSDRRETFDSPAFSGAGSDSGMEQLSQVLENKLMQTTVIGRVKTDH